MDFKQIEAFVKVVELASFSKAAEELYISQPSVSTYITSLEKELGTALINRSTKVLSTTLAGERFWEKARAMLSLKREAVALVQNLSGDLSGEVHIIASSVPAQYILPELLAEFHKRYPDITFVMRQADTSDVVQGIASHRADIGFAGSTMGDKKCDFFEFTTEELIFIAPNDGSYSQHKRYSLDELLDSKGFIARESGSGTRIQYERFFTENGIVLDKIKTSSIMDSTHSIIGAVTSGLGISMVSGLAARQSIVRGQIIPLKLQINAPQRSFYAVLSKSSVHSHLIKLFLEYIMEKGRKEAPAPA